MNRSGRRSIGHVCTAPAPVIADNTPEAARKSVNQHADQKVDIIKIRVDGEDTSPTKMKPEVYRAIIDEAHKRGLRVAAHLYYHKDAMGLLDAGADVIAHSVRDQDVTPELIAAIKKTERGLIPTLTRDLSVFVDERCPPFSAIPSSCAARPCTGSRWRS